ncbi:MAG: AAA family ATPase, partial [Methylococcaceae bacterium]|nr:AAA family ATPase [Methylococcaceae bacterium]
AIQQLSDERVITDLDWEFHQLQKRYWDYLLNVSRKKDRIIESSDNPKEELVRLKSPHDRFIQIINEFFQETTKKINQDENEIEFLLNNKEITAYELSAGEKQLLIIFLTVLIQDNKPSILFMDEPEHSLHMDWQEKVIQYIRELNPNVQLIIATHSPSIIMDGWLDKISELSDLIVNDKEK